MKIVPNNTKTLALALCALGASSAHAASLAGRTAPPEGVRERISIDAGWRFHRGDPDVDTRPLLYDVRPDLHEDDLKEKPADHTQAAAPLPDATHPLLKPWILPTGNAFLSDPTRRFSRPEGNPGGDVAYVQPRFDDSGWQLVDLPHDWAIAGPFDPTGKIADGGMGRLPSPGIGWYRRKLDVPANDAGKSIFLDVDGAMSYAAVWLNGSLVGGWPYGYASWRVNLTPYVKPGGDNVLAIRLDNPPVSSRWYPGGGIYRNVWLTVTSPVHVGQWGTYITTPHVSTASATIDAAVTVDNDSKADAAVSVTTRIYALDPDGTTLGQAVATILPVSATLMPGSSTTVRGSVVLPHPRLWGPKPQQTPHRYLAVTLVSRDGQLLDRYETPFGIRSVAFEADGVYINGQRIYIKGVNLHHDLGALGAAFNARAEERRLSMLQEMGCNAIRMSHNPPAPELMELCDRMGILAMDEIFDCWYRQKTPYDFHLIFPDWHEQDLRAFIRRDRNCPSVFLWSVGNEVGEQYTGTDGAAVAKQLCEIAHQEDATRPATASMNWASPTSPFAGAVDVISLNYQGAGIRTKPGQYPVFRAQFPSETILSSESAAALSTRGEYLFPIADRVSAPVRDGDGGDFAHRTVNAYELYAADFGSSADRVFESQERNPFAAGEFVWTGWDYLGEPTPYWQSRSSYFGIFDLAGFKKDRFYLYQAEWRPDFPMAHILPHWTWPERVGQVTPIHVFTSGDSAELFLNGKSLGLKKKEPYRYRLRWDDVVYQPGELKVVAYKNGKAWATDVVRTAGEPVRLEAAADRRKIADDGKDLAFVTIEVLDKNGITAPRANNDIEFQIEGPGEIVATDNGDPNDTTPFPTPERKAFNGLCSVIVRSKPGQTGPITLSATSGGLQGATVTVTVKSVEQKPL